MAIPKNPNHGLGLNPWLLFVAGTIIVLVLLYYPLLRALPGRYVAAAKGSRTLQYMILIFSAFAICIRGSGLHVVRYVYPDPQWMFGLIGFAAEYRSGSVGWRCPGSVTKLRGWRK